MQRKYQRFPVRNNKHSYYKSVPEFVDAAGNITGVGEGNCIIKVTSASDSNMYAEVKVTVKKQQGIQQIDGFTYVNGILIANKTYSLPASYNPQGLMPDTYSAFQELVACFYSPIKKIHITNKSVSF